MFGNECGRVFSIIILFVNQGYGHRSEYVSEDDVSLQATHGHNNGSCRVLPVN